MELTVGTVLEGKVKTITNFGAFIALPENKTGMVHISEVANAYVSDIRAHLTEGQDVKVVVIGNENNKINLSIKRLEPKPQRENAAPAPRREGQGNFRPAAPRNGENKANVGCDASNCITDGHVYLVLCCCHNGNDHFGQGGSKADDSCTYDELWNTADLSDPASGVNEKVSALNDKYDT